eukprot:COSAG01_NODE_113_length_25617_cov_10.523492_11_plen_83_part_00
MAHEQLRELVNLLLGIQGPVAERAHGRPPRDHRLRCHTRCLLRTAKSSFGFLHLQRQVLRMQLRIFTRRAAEQSTQSDVMGS